MALMHSRSQKQSVPLRPWLTPVAMYSAAPRAAAILAGELGRDASWAEQQVAAYATLARGYLLDDAV